MTTTRSRFAWLALPLMLVASVATAQTMEIEIGYRWLDLDGSESMYRSQINERDGFIIRAFTMTSVAGSAAGDRYKVTASDLGSTPAGMFRVEAAREGSYLLRVGYHTADAYSAIPGFANPLLSQGVIPGQHTFDRSRSTFDADLEFIPGRKFSPFIGYTHHQTNGPGRTTYFVGQDEFRLLSDLEDRTQEFRAGAAFNLGRVYGQVTQGWRDFNGRETFSLDAGEGSGNNVVPILGRNITIGSFTRHTRTDVSSPYTNAFVVGDVHSRVKLIGSFVHASAETDGIEDESLSGSFVSFPLGRFFNGLNGTAGSRANNTTWRGEGRAEIAIRDGIDFIAGYRREHREISGSAFVTSMFVDTITFSGADRSNLEEIIGMNNALEREEDTLSAMVSARAMGPFALRAGYSESNRDVTITPDLREIVISGGNAGTFERKVRTFDTAGTYSRRGFTLGAAWRHETADEPVFRTDFDDRDRIRVRASYARPMFSAGATAEDIDQQGVNVDNTIRQYSGDVTLSPLASLQLRASASRFDVDSNVTYRRPENFVIANSIHAEQGTSYEGGMTFFRAPFTLDVNGSRFENEGTTPFNVDRFRTRLVYDFLARAGIAAEWSRDEYREELAAFGDFDSTRYGIFLRFRP